jgi:hypothetical protein
MRALEHGPGALAVGDPAVEQGGEAACLGERGLVGADRRGKRVELGGDPRDASAQPGGLVALPRQGGASGRQG